ncbi:hypothetical protein BSKO_07597 [Bryopsis sp. KO-2023]|nr:hypothetical protein BSKO_07597 [Bryopsis sp. KO-2023]
MTSTLPMRALGKQGLEVPLQGLGCMGMSAFYSGHDTEEAQKESLMVFDRALELGCNFLDTSDIYGPFTNEELVGKAIKGRRDKFIIATKFGIKFEDGKMGLDSSPAHVRSACEASLKRLGIDCIDLYYQHRVDPATPIEETMKELKKLVEEGKIKYIGLSEAGPADVRKAHAVHPISAFQLEWSLWTRDAEKSIIPLCRELGIGIVAYSPLGRGFLTGKITSTSDLSDGDFRKNNPRFTEENFAKNQALVEKVKAVAEKKGSTPGQIALAWVSAQGEDVVPIPGTKRLKYLEENIASTKVVLTPEDLKELDFGEGDVHGQRYDEGHMSITHGGREAME